MKKNSLKYELLRVMYWVDKIQKNDLRLYGNHVNGKDTGATSKAIKELIGMEFIDEKDNGSILSITEKGRVYYADSKDLSASMFHENRFKGMYGAELNREMGISGLLAIMEVCGADALEKPSLCELWQHMADGKITDEKYFYTSRECREFIREKMNDDHGDDIIQRSRFRGFFISRYTSFIVYDSTSSNRRIRIVKNAEQKLKSLLEHEFRKVSSIGRTLPDGSKGGINALVLTRGTQVITELATGYKKGRTTPESKKLHEKWGNALSGQLLDATNSIFDRIFLVPSSGAGLDSLDYLVNHTYEEYLEEIKSNGILDLIYVPIYEIRILQQLSMLDAIVLTYPDMQKTIAHATGRHHRYLNGEYDPPVEMKETYDYNELGRIRGHFLIEQELTKRGYDSVRHFNSEKKKELPEVLGFTDKHLFYNSIGKSVSVSEVVSYLIEGKEPDLQNRKQYRRHRKTITIEVSNEFYLKLKKACSITGLSQGKYIMKYLDEALERSVL